MLDIKVLVKINTDIKYKNIIEFDNNYLFSKNLRYYQYTYTGDFGYIMYYSEPTVNYPVLSFIFSNIIFIKL